MHAATIIRLARLFGYGNGTGRLLVVQLRVTLGVLAVGSALLLQNHVASAQSVDPAQTAVTVTTPEFVAPDSSVPDNVAPESTTPAQATTAEETAITEAESAIHVIKAGDTLSNVAQRYGVEPTDLAAYNQILDYNHVVIGQKLRIPPVGVTITEAAPELLAIKPGAEGYHVIRKGESLSGIARLYNLTLEELMELNGVDNPNLVQIGTMLRLTAEVEPPTHVIVPELQAITHTVKSGDTLATIAKLYHTTDAQIRVDSKLAEDDLRVGQELQIFPPASALEAFGIDAPADGERKIVIDLSDQSLTAYQGDTVVLFSIVSTGKAATPTPPGVFAIYQKLKTQHMTGDDYDLPGVPWVMYYYDEYAIHGAYWHANFGIPTSHGCTNMTIPDSKALYSWAPIGTLVIVQE